MVLLLAGGVGLGVAACGALTPGEEVRWRRDRESAVRHALSEQSRPAFAGLAFFPYDPSARVRVMVEPVTPPQHLRLAASDGRVRDALRVGRVRPRLPGGQAALAVFQLDPGSTSGDRELFLPFRDAGAGSDTYAAGRYVAVRPLPGGVVEIDFNRAYNPDCAYGIAASCPVAPDENTLPFPVRAGERLPPPAG